MLNPNQKINFYIDFTALVENQKDELAAIYNNFYKIFNKEFKFSGRSAHSRIFYIILNYYSPGDKYIGYSNNSLEEVSRGDKGGLVLNLSEMKRFINEYLKQNKTKKYSKNIKIILELVRHK